MRHDTAEWTLKVMMIVSMAIVASGTVVGFGESFVSANSELVGVIKQLAPSTAFETSELEPQVYYYITDFMGNVRNVVKPAEYVSMQDYLPFGRENPYISIEKERGYFKYKSQLYDSLAKRYLVGGKLYDPDLGRQLQAGGGEHLYEPQQMNAYSAYENNPFRLVGEQELNPDLGIPDAPETMHAKAKVGVGQPTLITPSIPMDKPPKIRFYKALLFEFPDKPEKQPYVNFRAKSSVRFYEGPSYNFIHKNNFNGFSAGGSSLIHATKNWLLNIGGFGGSGITTRQADGQATCLVQGMKRAELTTEMGTISFEQLDKTAVATPSKVFEGSGEMGQSIAINYKGDTVRFRILLDGKPIMLSDEVELGMKGGKYMEITWFDGTKTTSELRAPSNYEKILSMKELIFTSIINELAAEDPHMKNLNVNPDSTVADYVEKNN